MEIRKMFYKKIDRDIKGVIKIGQEDDTNIRQELEEYVVTRELSKHLNIFFEAYKKGLNDYTDKMGTWISGFFGSGKSHLLKIVSYLLENKEIDGKKAISYFDDKIEDPMALADMKKIGDMGKHTDVILFNIDSKADSTSKSNKDAIVQVFMKVFNEMQGFCASLPWLADLERQMEKDGTYEAFQNKFEELSGSKWIDAREDFYFEEDNIIEALSTTTKMSEESARNWFNKAEENYSLSIEKFAQRVNEYIESKGNNHHVVFLVDEIGQYIGDDVGLMLNLQTVVEDLGTYCGGKAWVIVTSQQDIDSITKIKGNDFSKIQGRFNTRLNLSSANVDEVIKKRILRKTDVAKDTLKLKYQDKESILKNLITFSTDTAEMKTYKNEEDFAEVYPFVPYQFNLLQSVFTGIRLHGASGKHLSEGERSLLSAFQESAVKYMKEDIGVLVPFSAFYETVEAFLDSNIRSVILKAEDNERLIKEDIEVLKLLFLIKYVKEIPSNIENIATLMVNDIDEDKIELKKKIEESLKRLLKETLIQKNGNEYIFLTHEEQDVNKEIQHIAIDMGDTILKIGEEIFDGIYNEKKYRYNGRYHFDFNKIIDDRLLSSQKFEMGLKIITPYYDTGVELIEQELKMMSARENNLIVKLPMDTTFLEEMEDILKIQTYLLRKGGSTSTLEIEEIRIRKSREVTERKERVTNLLIEALRSAELYANSQKLDIKSKNPTERINEGFKLLIESMYSKLNYITTFIESNKDLNHILLEDNIQVKLTDDTPNKLAVEEVDNYIERNTERNIPMTLKSIVNLYEKAPYGWRDMDIKGIVLRLFKDQKIRLELGGEYLNTTDKNLIDYLTKRDYQDRLVIKKRIKTPSRYINNVKDLAKEVFGITALPSDEDGLMKKFKDLCTNELKMRNVDTSDYGIQFLVEQYKNNKYYPGKDVLENGEKLFEEIIRIKDVKEFYERVYELKDDLLDYEEEVFDVKKFFKNQKEEFDKAVRQLNIYEKNRTYVVDAETREIIGQIEKIVKSKEPYSQIHRLPNLVDEFINHFIELLEVECKPIRIVIENDRKMVLDEIELSNFNEELRHKFKSKFDDLLERLDTANNFYEAIAMKEESDRIKIRCFDEIEKEKEKRKPNLVKQASEIIHDNQATEEYKTKTVKNISITNILHGAKVIETIDDIDEVLEQIRKALQEELNDDTKLKLI
ncbi:BREX system P-loop protein BrxC [Clostridium cochlearium]|uniref:BREX system P-loop protein BrxC n=1 Tax=Clostridium cochlearium TaxID=1494 RepID=UPI001EE0F5AE|nr:BREX system P-loop protein BrxC [Clostridium cochlearium]MCG4580090.1 BREX system P-loop protein BrxC [Clostridium cochlearium]